VMAPERLMMSTIMVKLEHRERHSPPSWSTKC
jgi:hypothetical protein